jgi:hypothetical protein
VQRTVLALIVIVCTVGYLTDNGWLPKASNYLLEVFSAAILLYVLGVGIRNRFELVRAGYWIVFGCIILVMVCGILLNSVEPGPIFAGIRNYFRTIPFFFIGAVYAFSDAQIRRQLSLLTAICLVQVPVALWQRLAKADEGGFTGDTTMGTLQGASLLSIFLIGGISILIALQRRGFISFKMMLLLFVLFVFPTTINETRATFFMLPLTLLVTGIVLAKPGQRLKNTLVTLFAIIMFGAIFVPIYDRLIQDRPYGATMWDFMTKQGRAEGYFDRGMGVGENTNKEAGRGEMITVPVGYLAREPFHLLFGLGIGNASESSLGTGFGGRYFALFRPFLSMTFSRVVLELGLLGVGLTLLLFWMIYRDARVVAARDDGLMGSLAAGWTGVTALIVIGFFYKDLIMVEGLTVPFWLYSGIIAAHRTRLELQHRRERAAAAARPPLPVRRRVPVA